MRNRRQSGPKSVAAVVRTARAPAVIAMLLCCSAGQMRAQGTSAFTEVDRVRGVVINSVTREPVGRALVYSPDNAYATMTDDRGRFEFVFPRPEPETVAPPADAQVRKHRDQPQQRWTGTGRCPRGTKRDGELFGEDAT